MDFLELTGKTIVVFGVANRRSVAFAVSRVLREAGASLLYVVRDTAVRDAAARLLDGAPIMVCDVERDEDVQRLPAALAEHSEHLDGMLHSIAFANYANGVRPFLDTRRADFLQAVDVSCYSLTALVQTLKPMFRTDASIVTISISTTRMAAENYGYMGPIKAALDSSVVFLAKSLSADTRIRVNAVGAGLLKTSASAGIPGYVDSYLFAERVIPRGQGLGTDEVANVAAFLLSPRSSGINAQTVVTDAGMAINYFDRDVIRAVVDAGSARSAPPGRG